MMERLITSSVLILALLAVRKVFRKTLSQRLQYALWGFVVLRLLLPFHLPGVRFSVLTAAQPMQTVVTQQLQQPGLVFSQFSPSAALPHMEGTTVLEPASIEKSPAGIDTAPKLQEPTVSNGVPSGNTLPPSWTPAEILQMLWKAGMCGMAGFLLFTNLRFWQNLRKYRIPCPLEARYAQGNRKPSRSVYLVPEGLSSPCLFGLFRPAIYLTPASLASKENLKYVLAHEETHARHWDPLWSLLRCVCLTVYWFDPLVWIAAAVSKTDCELACDEGVLAKLDVRERISYGETLLSLVPVQRPNLLLSTTTMAAGKEELKDRISRIAHKPKQVAAVAGTVLVLIGIVSACTFTGALQSEDKETSLTEEELGYFNGEYFNGDYLNFRQQFLSSLYEKPEDINLYELFYLGDAAGEIDTFSDEEIRTILQEDPDNLPCPVYKLTTARMNETLQTCMGLTLDQTNCVGLENMIYSEEYDAYYFMHGDTNYRGEVTFAVGTRENDTIHLYYDDTFMTDGWKCLTLNKQEDGTYWFYSNAMCAKPEILKTDPDGKPSEPSEIIPLDDLKPYQAPAVTELLEVPLEDMGTAALQHTFRIDPDQQKEVCIYHVTGGKDYAALLEPDHAALWFLSMSQYQGIDTFVNLFGYEGFILSYRQETEAGEETVSDCYYFDTDGKLNLLVRCFGKMVALQDWNEDGKAELSSSKELFFERDGSLHEVRLDEYLPEEWEHHDWKSIIFDFDGENLLIFKTPKTHTNHMVDGADQDIPLAVVEAAKAHIESLLIEQDDGTFSIRSPDDGEEITGMSGKPETFDDWRIESFPGKTFRQVGDLTIGAWTFNFECHATDPNDIVLAGGRYLTEDGWVSPGYGGTDCLFFQADGETAEIQKYLWHDRIDMDLESFGFRRLVETAVENLGLDTGKTSYAALHAQRALDHIMDGGENQVYVKLSTPDGKGGNYLVTPDVGFNGRYFQSSFTNPDSYQWSFVEGDVKTPSGTTLMIADVYYDYQIQFWEGSDLVQIKQSDLEPIWYRAESQNDPNDVFYEQSRIFPFMRGWFDEVELINLPDRNSFLPDKGQSREALAQAWAEQWEGAYLKTTPGSKFARTYVQVCDVALNEDIPRENYPASIGDREAFAFSYRTIFVPGNETALSWMMGGNTEEYKGNDPNVPENALSYWRCGYLYRTDRGWSCCELGTGW